MATWEPATDQWWFKAVGAAEWPMDENWSDVHPNETELIHFVKQPKAVRVGDPLLSYAAVHQKIFGIVDVFTKPARDPQRDRWPWFSQVRPKVIIKSFDRHHHSTSSAKPSLPGTGTSSCSRWTTA